MTAPRVIADIAIAALRPSQACVGYREVARKRAAWRAHVQAHGPSVPPRLGVPVVLGPSGRPYAIDRHHTARALLDEGVSRLPITVVADASALSEADFWTFLADRCWGRRLDVGGRTVDWRGMPPSVADLADDPYRSLAGALRRAGGYVKQRVPCSEFAWADFLRPRIDPVLLRDDFDTALARALVLATSAAPQTRKSS